MTTIGEAAREAGVGVETVRFYERRGLIEQPRKPQGSVFRVYSPDHIKTHQIHPAGPAVGLFPAGDS